MKVVNNDGPVTSWAGLLLRPSSNRVPIRPNFGQAVNKSGPNPWMPENARISQVPVLRGNQDVLVAPFVLDANPPGYVPGRVQHFMDSRPTT